ncbi:hypothetical protein G647_05354 [Cladophialophora carrionii CBS 160.54]|uniref:Xylanolytic transcriptional activator regulatory domain-containing protein n=1 Tax=Cladophialophora carrionii CBS 160.54 TaxID=1279043 RepID=V9DC53_9EURO|nr:uncharacterized protein G647_05354 [Cladophialophora carrionii CBS 160.54]ETI23552.1 hypothetical protein G647_05354 [Cladophialophora carrionii CBS 160.54]
MSLTGMPTTEQGTPTSYPTADSVAQGQPDDGQGSRSAAIQSFTQGISPHSTAAMNEMRSETYCSQVLRQWQTASNMLPSPPVLENEVLSGERKDCLTVDYPLEAPDCTELGTYSSTHWLLEDDFDFTVFDHLGSSNAFESQPVCHNNVSVPPLDRAPEKPKQRLAVSDLRRLWYVQTADVDSEAGSGTVTPAGRATGPPEDIDEAYRDKLARTLRPPIRDEPLPSIEFLNLCIHLFFTKFNVALPLIHGPTFRPQNSNALLVLSICSAGCLSLGSEVAAKIGSMLFERVNKTILVAPWERVLPRSNDHTWNIAKAAMIGQTYALTSGDPAHRATAAAYHGSIISLARHHKLLSPGPSFRLAGDLSTDQLDKAWRSWVKQEELRRVAVLLYIHDAEIAALFHHEPIFRHNAGYIPAVCSQELFSAPTAAIWASLFRTEAREAQFHGEHSRTRIQDHSGTTDIGARNQSTGPVRTGLSNGSMLSVYNSLSGIAASVCECWHLDLLSSTMVNKFESDLLTWYASSPKAFKVANDYGKQTESPFSLLPLWHYTFIALSTNLDLLERAVGREGTDIASSTSEYVLSWIASPDSKRCLLHALFLQNLMVSTNIGALVALHTPRILFSAALCWYCYVLYRPDSSPQSAQSARSLPDLILEPLNSLPEIQLLRESGSSSKSTNIYPVPHIFDQTLSTLPQLLGANSAEMQANTLCVIESMLRRLGMTGISLRFADIIQAFIFRDVDQISLH